MTEKATKKAKRKAKEKKKPSKRGGGRKGTVRERALATYIGLGPDRTLVKAVAEMGKKPEYVKVISKWSVEDGWREKAEAWDREQFAAALEQRAETVEQIRLDLLDSCLEAVKTIERIMRGEFPSDAGAFDRYGRPIIKPSTRLQAAAQVLDRAGIIAPKRVELTGADGKDLRVEMRRRMSDMDDAQLAALGAAFGVAVDVEADLPN